MALDTVANQTAHSKDKSEEWVVQRGCDGDGYTAFYGELQGQRIDIEDVLVEVWRERHYLSSMIFDFKLFIVCYYNHCTNGQ